MTTKKRITLSIAPELVKDLEEIAYNIGRERGKRCEKSELAEIALTAFVVGYHNEKAKRKED